MEDAGIRRYLDHARARLSLSDYIGEVDVF